MKGLNFNGNSTHTNLLADSGDFLEVVLLWYPLDSGQGLPPVPLLYPYMDKPLVIFWRRTRRRDITRERIWARQRQNCLTFWNFYIPFPSKLMIAITREREKWCAVTTGQITPKYTENDTEIANYYYYYSLLLLLLLSHASYNIPNLRILSTYRWDTLDCGSCKGKKNKQT